MASINKSWMKKNRFLVTTIQRSENIKMESSSHRMEYIERVWHGLLSFYGKRQQQSIRRRIQLICASDKQWVKSQQGVFGEEEV